MAGLRKVEKIPEPTLNQESLLTPRQIVEELDKYIIGQHNAKKMVAIALRNRWRRQQVPEDLRDEIAPKNIVMIGPTGIGKTEIARRLARLAQAPFVKVEASRYTEVGYVGRDVESMVRDLTEIAVNMVKEEEKAKVWQKAKDMAEEKLLDILLPTRKRSRNRDISPLGPTFEVIREEERETQEKLRRMLEEGKLDERYVELETSAVNMPPVEVMFGAGLDAMEFTIKDMLGNILPRKSKKRKVRIAEARDILAEEEVQKLIDMEKVTRQAIQRVENSGIIFLDEIDKIAGRESGHGPDVSREGVQRDLLPIVEGSTVVTKHGMVRTDHILFIAAGAFHVSKPSDLIPEIQGRFPIRVELDTLTTEDFVRILTEPQNALIKQYKALLKTEGIELEFTKDSVEEIASLATHVNDRTENIGARRLHTIMEKLLEDISFNAPDEKKGTVIIDAKHVKEKLSPIIKDEDLSRSIL